MKNTIKGNFVGFTNGDPTITNSKVTIKAMTNNKQQTAVEWLWEIAYNRDLTVEDWKQAKEMEKEQRSIKLPTDEEIREVIKPFQNEMDDFDLGFRNGVQWLREKIQEDNDKQ